MPGSKPLAVRLGRLQQELQRQHRQGRHRPVLLGAEQTQPRRWGKKPQHPPRGHKVARNRHGRWVRLPRPVAVFTTTAPGVRDGVAAVSAVVVQAMVSTAEEKAAAAEARAVAAEARIAAAEAQAAAAEAQAATAIAEALAAVTMAERRAKEAEDQTEQVREEMRELECELDYYEGGYQEEQEAEQEHRREQGLPPEMTEEEMWWIREWNQARLRGERDPWMSFATFQEYTQWYAPSITEEEMRGRCQGGPETAAPWLVGACPCETDDTDSG